MKGFRFRNFSFQPGLWPSVAAAVVVAVTVSLGNWQTRRAEQKLHAQDRLDARARAPALDLPAVPVKGEDFADFPVSVRGEFAAGHTLYLDNKVMRGVVGYYVLTPLRIAGGKLHVMVNRGWVAAGPRRDRVPQIRTPEGELTLEGIAVVPARFHYELGPDPGAGSVVQNLALEHLAKRTGMELQPIVLQQTSNTSDGLVRHWERPDLRVNTHRAYAVQWYAMGILVVVLYIIFNVRRVSGAD